MASSARDSEVFNFRIPKSLYETLKALAGDLDVSVNTVVTSSLMWARLEPAHRGRWIDDVDEFRRLLDTANLDNSISLFEMSLDEFTARDEACKRLVNIGLIESYACRQSTRTPGSVLCTYRLTIAGRVIAATLRDSCETRRPGDVGNTTVSERELMPA